MSPETLEISKNTTVSASVGVAAVLATIAVMTWAQDDRSEVLSQIRGLSDQIREMKYEMRGIREDAIDRYTGADMQDWVHRFQRANPSLAVPDARGS